MFTITNNDAQQLLKTMISDLKLHTLKSVSK